MLLQLDFSSDLPIYLQIRNQIVLGIASGALVPGECLPTIRTLADEAGVNMMTVSKAYQLLKQEGYIRTDRRSGAVVSGNFSAQHGLTASMQDSLRLTVSEAKLQGVPCEEFLAFCRALYDETKENPS